MGADQVPSDMTGAGCSFLQEAFLCITSSHQFSHNVCQIDVLTTLFVVAAEE